MFTHGFAVIDEYSLFMN